MLPLKEFLSTNKILIPVMLGIFLIGFWGSYYSLNIFKKPTVQASLSTQEDKQEEPQEPFEPINTQNSYNVLLLGSGGDGHSGGALTDSIIIVSVDANTKKANLISIPRDLWVPGNRKINSEVMANGINGLKSTLTGVTGLEIEKYVSIDFGNLVKLINELGGIDVDIPKTFDDYFYPIKGKENETCGMSADEIYQAHQKYSGFELEKQFKCRWEHIHYDKGTSHISGEDALKIARSRHGDSDFGRSARQFAILKGIANKVSLENINDNFKTLSKLVKADIDLKTTRELINLFGSPADYEINGLHLSTQNVLNESKSSDGQYILVPKAGNFNFSEIKNFISQ